MNKNPTSINALNNLSKCINPKETELEKAQRIAKEISWYIGELKK